MNDFVYKTSSVLELSRLCILRCLILGPDPFLTNSHSPTGSGEMGKPGRDRAPSPVNPGDSATRQEVCHEGPPTRSRWGGYHLARPGGPPEPKNI